jgi:glycosyltransferase A (GT-A) superfamily protein (DUF2064 family)
MRRPLPEIFDAMVWSGPQVLAATLERAKRLGLMTALAPEWRDIDTPSDLAELQANVHRLDPELSPRTCRWLERSLRSQV